MKIKFLAQKFKVPTPIFRLSNVIINFKSIFGDMISALSGTGEKKELGSTEEMGSIQGGSQAFKADI